MSRRRFALVLTFAVCAFLVALQTGWNVSVAEETLRPVLGVLESAGSDGESPASILSPSSTRQRSPSAEPLVVVARPANGDGHRGVLPNGGPGLSRAFATTASFLEVFARGSPPTAAALLPLPFILDSFSLSCDTAFDAAGQGALARALGRTRLSATVAASCFVATARAADADVRVFLNEEAPAWRLGRMRLDPRVASPAAGEALPAGAVLGASTWWLERRVKVFTFAITGGRDGRARLVENTWGQRTPLQWYADEWTDALRPIVDVHPQYDKDRFAFLVFKISRIWQRVYEDYGPSRSNHTYDWYARLWDDNYFYEENLFNTLGRLRPDTPQMAGKIAWRNLGVSDVYPFAGGGAGWFLSRTGMELLGLSIAAAEKWFYVLRAKRNIFLPHAMHDEDVFLTAWLDRLNVSFVNIPGVEHVSPGLGWKQRCLTDQVLFDLRWNPNETIFYDYPAHEARFRIEEHFYSFAKPIVWHYMSPTRLVRLETLLYPKRKDDPLLQGLLPMTDSDKKKPAKRCYPGVWPAGTMPSRGFSVFEKPLRDPPLVVEAAFASATA